MIFFFLVLVLLSAWVKKFSGSRKRNFYRLLCQAYIVNPKLFWNCIIVSSVFTLSNGGWQRRGFFKGLEFIWVSSMTIRLHILVNFAIIYNVCIIHNSLIRQLRNIHLYTVQQHLTVGCDVNNGAMTSLARSLSLEKGPASLIYHTHPLHLFQGSSFMNPPD